MEQIYQAINEAISKGHKYCSVPYSKDLEGKKVITFLRNAGYTVEINQLDSLLIIHWSKNAIKC